MPLDDHDPQWDKLVKDSGNAIREMLAIVRYYIIEGNMLEDPQDGVKLMDRETLAAMLHDQIKLNLE